VDIAQDEGTTLLAKEEVRDGLETTFVDLRFEIHGDDFQRVEPRVYVAGLGCLTLRQIRVKSASPSYQ